MKSLGVQTHIIDVPIADIQRARFLTSIGRHFKVDPADTLLERRYITYLLNSGLTAQQVISKIDAPLRFVRHVELSPAKDPVPPPEGYKSRYVDDYSDHELASYAKWMLKNGVSPEKTAEVLQKREAWVYQIISGQIHRSIRPRDPREEREPYEKKLFVKNTRAPRTPRTQEGRDLAERRLRDAGYVLWLNKTYTHSVIAKIMGWTYQHVRGVCRGEISKSAEAVEPPDDWKLEHGLLDEHGKSSQD